MLEKIRQRISELEKRNRADLRLVRERKIDRASYVDRHVESTRAMLPNLVQHAAQISLCGLTMLAPRKRRVKPMPDDGFRPVIFVHGMNGGGGNFLPMRLYFRANGRRRSYAIHFDESSGADGMSDHLNAFIHQVISQNRLSDEQQVDIVAHSLGGLITRYAMRRFDATRQRIANLITLGTPHFGTQISRLWPAKMARPLRPGSRLLAVLEAQLPWGGPPDLPRLVSYWSRSDLLLMPRSNARVPGATNIEIPDYTHYDYLLDTDSWRRVYDVLQG